MEVLRSLRAGVSGLFRSPAPAPAKSRPLEPITLMSRVPVPMRDGVTLYADLYRPRRQGRFPVLVVRTPYGGQQEGTVERMIFFARNGYAVLVQDVRGRYESEGSWRPFLHDVEDGWDTIEWAAAQPWSNGRVGMEGASYPGFAQWLAAGASPPSLATIFPIVGSTSVYHDWIGFGGAFHLAFNYGWGVVRMPSRTTKSQEWHTELYVPEDWRYEKILWHLPLNDGDLLSSNQEVPHYREWLAHPCYDDFWRRLSVREKFHDIRIPVHTWGGWYDIFLAGTLDGFTGMRNHGGSEIARRETKMVVGPWGHGLSTKVGEVDFGKGARFPMARRELRWYDRYLKDEDNGINLEPPAKIFFMGINRWFDAEDWPLPGTRYTQLYIASGGHAGLPDRGGTLRATPAAGPNEASYDRYLYDPNHPVPTHGGKTCCGSPTPSGPRDQRVVEAREDVLKYTGEPLRRALAIAGPVRMRLFAATDGPDTDFMARLVDVFPNGYAMNVAEGVIRARFRRGFERMELLEPNQIYEYDIDLVGTAHVFLPRHSIRVDITSSNFPQFDRNTNTGEPPAEARTTRIARQTVYHTRDFPSHVLLPVVDVPG